MLAKANCLFLRYSCVISLLGLAAVPAIAAEPKVYRCGPEGSQWFSQIPCEEDSEEVVVEDHPMFSESVEGDALVEVASGADEPGSAGEKDEDAKAQAFIDQLEKQRSEQLADIDGRIEALETRAAAADEVANGADSAGGEPGGAAESNAEQDEVLEQLAILKRNRQSMVSEYDAMISAARQRIDTP